MRWQKGGILICNEYRGYVISAGPKVFNWIAWSVDGSDTFEGTEESEEKAKRRAEYWVDQMHDQHHLSFRCDGCGALWDGPRTVKGLPRGRCRHCNSAFVIVATPIRNADTK